MINWQKVPGEVVVVISDLHSNFTALQAALNQAKTNRMDKLIILGDLLTYGVDVEQVADAVAELQQTGARLILGNHDEVYLDQSNQDYYDVLPEWIKESIEYNMKKLDVNKFSSLKWEKDIVLDNVLYSHANPYGDWRYLNTPKEMEAALEVLQQRALLAGVFGHNHRSICYSVEAKQLPEVNGLSGVFLLNPGSIGQPRIKPPISTILRLSAYQNKLWAQVEQVIYEQKQHIETLITSSLSEPTKQKLISFFKG